MDANVLLTILGIVLTHLGLGIGAYVKVVQRLTKIETIIEFRGEKALRKMHSPDDHLGLDAIVDEYFLHYDLPKDKWLRLFELCEGIIESEKSSVLEKVLAKDVVALCIHKLSGYGIRKVLKTMV
jgi:hypothetical protein